MAQVTYPAREYLSGVPLIAMDRGGYQRRVNTISGAVVWYFSLPIETPVYSLPDSVVPTINGKPIVTIANWQLDQTVWIRLKEKPE